MKRGLDVTKDVTYIAFNNLTIPSDNWFCVLDYLDIEDLHRLKTVSKLLHRFTHLYARLANLGIFAIYSGPSYNIASDLGNKHQMTCQLESSHLTSERSNEQELVIMRHTKTTIVRNVCIRDFITMLGNIKTPVGKLVVVPLIMNFENSTSKYGLARKSILDMGLCPCPSQGGTIFHDVIQVIPECDRFKKLVIANVNIFLKCNESKNRQIICAACFLLDENQRIILHTKMQYGVEIPANELIQFKSQSMPLDEKECQCRLHQGQGNEHCTEL